jgi:hypothetical protein
MRHRSRLAAFLACLPALLAWQEPGVAAQTFTQRGFAEAAATVFPQDAPSDDVNTVGDLLVREEAFVKPADWLRLAAGIDLRLNSHDQVARSWRVDIGDRSELRPAISLRRLTATLSRGPLTVDIGKQFIRWGKTDILNPTDRFAPRDFVNVISTEFLGVSGVRGVLQHGAHTLDVVWLPVFTPSRLPLFTQRWAPSFPLQLTDAGGIFPDASQAGVRYSRVARRLEYSLSAYSGFNHLPNLEVAAPLDAGPPEGNAAIAGSDVPTRSLLAVRRIYPTMRSYGADLAMPTRWLTIKAETAYATSNTEGTDDYVLYVIEVERQVGEWQLLGGYAGEAVTNRSAAVAFTPDRGLTGSIVGRAAYTIGPNRSVAFEGAARQNGHGVYSKVEYSEARGPHWRTTITGVLLAGRADDFLGQYHRNSHAALALRYSF